MTDWSEVVIGGKSADIFVPEGATSALLFLHGHGRISLKDNAVYTRELARHNLACICPAGQRSWWGERICAEFDAAISPADFIRTQLLPWMRATWSIAPPQIALLGVSMGGQGALKLSYRSPQIFPTVAALAPAIDLQNWYGLGLPLDEIYISREAARQDSAVLHLHPLNWPRHQLICCDPDDYEWFEGAQRMASKLASTGIPFESDFETRAGGHSWAYFNHIASRVCTFLKTSLDQEQARLPSC